LSTLYKRLELGSKVEGLAGHFEKEGGTEVKMPYQCVKCNKEIEKQQSYDHQGKLFCEDCYMDVLSPLKACDPWAVHSAKTFLRGKDKLSTLTPLQLKIVDYIRGKGEATIEEMVENLNLAEEVLRREFAVLRHVEVLRAAKKDGKIVYKLF
jgi:DNA-directed RNA polymerase subunit RPC12/RpoP